MKKVIQFVLMGISLIAFIPLSVKANLPDGIIDSHNESVDFTNYGDKIEIPYYVLDGKTILRFILSLKLPNHLLL